MALDRAPPTNTKALVLDDIFVKSEAKEIVWGYLQSAIQTRVKLGVLTENELKNFIDGYYFNYLIDKLENQHFDFKIDASKSGLVLKQIATIICQQMHALSEQDVKDFRRQIERKAGSLHCTNDLAAIYENYSREAVLLLEKNKTNTQVIKRVKFRWKTIYNSLYESFQGFVVYQFLLFAGLVTGFKLIDSRLEKNDKDHNWLQYLAATILILIFFVSRKRMLWMSYINLGPTPEIRLKNFMIYTLATTLKKKHEKANVEISFANQYYDSVKPDINFAEKPCVNINVEEKTAEEKSVIKKPPKRYRSVATTVSLPTSLPIARPQLHEVHSASGDSYFLIAQVGLFKGFLRVNQTELTENFNANIAEKFSSVAKNCRSIDSKNSSDQGIKRVGPSEKEKFKGCLLKMKIKAEDSRFKGGRIGIAARSPRDDENNLLGRDGERIEIYSPRNFVPK